jgi:hypothetical protein
MIACTDGQWHAVIDGTEHPSDPDPIAAPFVSRVWEWGTFIDEHEYRRLLMLKEEARWGDPDHPCLHATTKIDRMRIRPLTPPAPRTPILHEPLAERAQDADAQ